MPNFNQISKQPSPPRPLINKRLVAAMAFVALLGFADAAYLTADHYYVLPLPCTITHGCETVLTSTYAMVGPIPLAMFGVAFYLAMIVLSLAIITSDTPSFLIVRVLALLAVVGAVMSVIFISMQAFLIHAFCMYCLGSALCTFILFFLSILLWRGIFSKTAHSSAW